MGLDIYASRSPDDIALTDADLQAFSDACIELSGGLFSGDPGSFRGKVYDTLLLDITQAALYRPWIPPEEVQSMYAALLGCDPAALFQSYIETSAELDQDYRGDSLETLAFKIRELRKFFRICTERGLGLLCDY
jgi:hypothetical protein